MRFKFFWKMVLKQKPNFRGKIRKTEWKWRMHVQKDIDTARDEAIAFLLEACDITDVDLAEEYSLGWNYWGTDIQTEYDGYCFQFTRTVGSSRTFLASMELFTMDWKYTSEYFTVCVDDNGIVNAELQYRGTKIEETDITLKNFDEITEMCWQNDAVHFIMDIRNCSFRQPLILWNFSICLSGIPIMWILIRINQYG